MINSLKRLLKGHSKNPEQQREHDISLAIAALMIEIMRMDGQLEAAEHVKILQLLQQRFRLTGEELHTLVERAGKAAGQALDLHQFTSVVIRHYSSAERQDIIADLWRVAMADGHVDPYEEQLIRRTSELIGLHHRQFIKAKLQAQET